MDRSREHLRARGTSQRGRQALRAVGLRAPASSLTFAAAPHPDWRDETADRIRAIMEREADDGRLGWDSDDGLPTTPRRPGE